MSLTTTFFNDREIIETGKEQIEMLKEAAIKDPFKRARQCLHKSNEDQIHEMIITLCRGSYVRPHRHTNKSESFHIIEGELTVIFFDDTGAITGKVEMGAPGNDRTFLYRLNDNRWHTVVPLSRFVVFHETTAGPFVEGKGEFAAWAPDNNNELKIKEFMYKIYSNKDKIVFRYYK